MRLVPTILLALLAIFAITCSVFLTVDGNLARLTGWYRFEPGMPLFPPEKTAQLTQAKWMRIEDLNDTIECERKADGTWWIIKPFHDRMSRSAVQAILSFTAQAELVDTLPLNNTTRGSLREFGVESTPHTITIKVPSGENSLSSIARYTLGSTSPWMADAEDGEHVLPTTYLRTDFYGRDKRIHVVTGNILSFFKEGLSALRDPHPLDVDPTGWRHITITRPGVPDLKFQRLSTDSEWIITEPIPTRADQDQISKLVNGLVSLSAIRVDESQDVSLPDEKAFSLEIQTDQAPGAPLRLDVYPAFLSPETGQRLCYAVASNRSVVFTLQAEPHTSKYGSFSSLIQAVYELPVLPEKAMAQLRSGNRPFYVHELPLRLDELRSRQFANLNVRDVDRVSLRSRFARAPLKLIRIPGNAESEVEDTWMFSAAGLPYEEAETAVVQRFLNALKEVPVTGYIADIPIGKDPAPVLHRYGLNAPDYVLSILPQECRLRATLFGCDLPLVRDRAPQTYLIKRYHDSKQGESYWVGTELGGGSIARLRPKLTGLFSLRPESWRRKNIVRFPLSALRKLTLVFQQETLALDYDYIGENWSGTLNGKDVSLRINPHRAEYYLRHLQKLKVHTWLEPTDEEARQALRHPVFSVRLDLELTDYSDAEQTVVEQEENSLTGGGHPFHGQSIETMLSGKGETDLLYQELATQERKTHPVSITIDIAPANMADEKTLFYGRIRETGALFTLKYQDAQSLAGNLLSE